MQETINLLWLNFVANQQIFLHYITEVFLIKWLQLKQNQIFAIAKQIFLESEYWLADILTLIKIVSYLTDPVV